MLDIINALFEYALIEVCSLLHPYLKAKKDSLYVILNKHTAFYFVIQNAPEDKNIMLECACFSISLFNVYCLVVLIQQMLIIEIKSFRHDKDFLYTVIE